MDTQPLVSKVGGWVGDNILLPVAKGFGTYLDYAVPTSLSVYGFVDSQQWLFNSIRSLWEQSHLALGSLVGGAVIYAKGRSIR